MTLWTGHLDFDIAILTQVYVIVEARLVRQLLAAFACAEDNLVEQWPKLYEILRCLLLIVQRLGQKQIP